MGQLAATSHRTYSVVVTDLDDTLFDWVAIWHACFTAMLDRLLHHAHILKTGPRSWRTRERAPLRAKADAR